MAADGAWPQILRHGLLSTSAILDLLGVSGDRRHRLEEDGRASDGSTLGTLAQAAFR